MTANAVFGCLHCLEHGSRITGPRQSPDVMIWRFYCAFQIGSVALLERYSGSRWSQVFNTPRPIALYREAFLFTKQQVSIPENGGSEDSMLSDLYYSYLLCPWTLSGTFDMAQS